MEDLLTKEKQKVEVPRSFNVVMFNDDYTHMDFVILVLVEVFGKTIEEAVTLAVQGRSPMIASIETDLPDPDSPISAKTSPPSTLKLTSLTMGRRLPSSLRASIFSFSTSRSEAIRSFFWKACHRHVPRCRRR